MKNSFVLYTDYLPQLQLLSMEQRGVLFTAIMHYSSGMDLPDMDGMTSMAFSFIKTQIDRDNEKYQQTVEARREAGRRGGKKKSGDEANDFSDKQSEAKEADNDNVNDNDNDNDKKKNTMSDAAALFERLWKLYPNKKGKGQVSDTQKKLLLATGEAALVKAIERYSTELMKDAGWRKPQNGSTFFNSGYKDYLDENYEPSPEPEKKKPTGNQFRNFEERDIDYDAMIAQQWNQG